MNKKGALELSVNAIVILVLAIVMLGLGLGFVRGMFTKVSTQFEEQISAEPEPQAPTGSNPITLSRETIVARAKDNVVLKIAAYNPTKDDWTSAQPELSCGTTLTLTGIQVNPKDIKVGEKTSYNVIVPIPAASAATFLCKANMKYKVGATDATGASSVDFTIKIVQ